MEQCNARPQDDDQKMFYHIEGLLTYDFKGQMKYQPQLYTIYGPGVVYPSGLLLLKLILSYAERDTHVAVIILRLKMVNLMKHITELFHDNIVDFNRHVRGLILDFIKYDAPYDALHAYVLWSYEKVDDEEFVRFVRYIMYYHIMMSHRRLVHH